MGKLQKLNGFATQKVFVPILKVGQLFRKNQWLAISTGSIFSIAVVLAGIKFLWILPERTIESKYFATSISEFERAQLIDLYRNTLISGVGTVATTFGGIVLYLNLKNATRNTEIANRQAEIANFRLELDTQKNAAEARQAEFRLASDRFSKAIEQLGNESSIHVRMGGIFSLEKIGKDSLGYHWTAIEVLSAFIRERSPTKPNTRRQNKITADIQVALKVLSRLSEYKQPEGIIKLESVNLCGADFRDTVFRNTIFSGHFTLASFDNAKLEGSWLVGWFDRTSFVGAKLRGARLSGINLRSSYLFEADFTEADLSDANLDKIRWNDKTKWPSVENMTFIENLPEKLKIQLQIPDEYVSGETIGGWDELEAEIDESDKITASQRYKDEEE